MTNSALFRRSFVLRPRSLLIFAVRAWDRLSACHARGEIHAERNSLKADWGQVDDTPMEMLVNALCAGCPFSPVEKQALVEAETLKNRAEALIALLEMDVTGNDEGWMQ